MDSVDIDQAEKKSEEASDAELLLSDASDPNGFFDIPLVSPRIGDEYQAETPPLLTHSQLFDLSMNPIKSESTIDTASNLFLMGLPIPITWICNEKEERSKVDPASFFPVPGLSPESWSDFEVECFVLGLYIFGKNLVQVQKFMATKDVGQIQCFYYGRFYKSPRYCKWVDCRKMRNKKSVMGSKIFSGCRQQELLSRLLPHLSEEAKITFQEISNALVEERTSLEEYVSSLKKMLGIGVLVDAVRIGKGKEDLTTLVTENSKSGQRQRVRPPELPSGKACSSLTTAEIIKFLTSDIRLSKTKSNDLFWEAVWPRLLAKGWHSEQPNDICTAPKNNLVFLMPGVKKFSRWKLTNGTHYFDSVSDVLRKVASEPQLLDLDVEENNDCVVFDNVDDHKEKDRPCYLKPTQGVGNVMKFTVIDTSLPSKVRELRNLPVEENGTHLYRDYNMKSQKVKSPRPIKSNVVSLSGKSNHSGTAIKRRRLTGQNFTEMGLKLENPSFVLCLPAPSKDKKFKFRECSKGKRSVSPSPANLSVGESKPHLLLIDLNLPIVPMEPEIDYELKMEDHESATVKTEAMEGISEEVQNSSSRRLSTRTRPLTTKALEALEIGFLSIRQSKKRSSGGLLDRKTRKNRQARSDEASYGEMVSSDGVGDGKMDVVSSPLVQNNETAWPVNC